MCIRDSLWHISHEGLELENPANEPNYDDLLVLSTTPEKAPDKDEYVTMTFEAGVPKSVNGKEMKVSEIITELNRLGAVSYTHLDVYKRQATYSAAGLP